MDNWDLELVSYMFNKLKPIKRNEMMKVLYFSNAYMIKVSGSKLFGLKSETRNKCIVYPFVYDNWDNIEKVLNMDQKNYGICEITKTFLDEVCEYFSDFGFECTDYNSKCNSYSSPAYSLPSGNDFFKMKSSIKSSIYACFGDYDEEEKKFIEFIETKDNKRRMESLKNLNKLLTSSPWLFEPIKN